MTSTNTWQGLNVDARPSSKVLKPPGGGSSDIFGTSGGAGGGNEMPSGPAGRRTKNHLASNLFLSDEMPSQQATSSKTPGNSFTNLFGPPSPPKTPLKTSKAPKNQLNLRHTDNEIDGVSEAVTPVRGRLHSPRRESNGDAHDGGVIETKSNGNVASMNGTATPAMNGNVKPMTNGNVAPAQVNGNGPAAPRQRVPPGGYSSGLW